MNNKYLYVYVACGDNVPDRVFPTEIKAQNYVDTHEGYDTVTKTRYWR